MDLSKILSISGKAGLFKLISQTKNNFIVESLIDGKRFAESTQNEIAFIENITIFCEDDDISILKVFQLIYRKEDGKEITPISNQNEQLKSYFKEVLPTYDKERVYVSNIKKLLQWYNLLVSQQLIDLEEEKEEAKEDEKVEETVTEENREQKVKNSKNDIENKE